MLKRYLQELKERKVLRWISIYFSIALTVTGAVNLFGTRYNFPDYIFDSLVVLILIGIPSILIMAWYHGKGESRKIKKKEILFHSIIALVGMFFLADIFHFPNFNLTSIKEHSIAVLPFDNLSAQKEDEYFTEGVMEDILTQLSKINELRVISKTSVEKYRNSKQTIPEIARELGVASILEGSVQRFGNRVRIVSQLVDTKDDKNLWAETYDREIKDVFVIQTEVAEKIAQALKAHLTNAEKDLISKKSTNNIDAYTLYLKAREYYNIYSYDNNEKSIDLFKKAINIDGNYALAYAGLADAYAQRVQRFGFDEAWLDSSEKMGIKAVSLEPKLAEGYKALGVIYALRGDFISATEEYNKAVKLNPNYAPALANLGSMYWWQGKYDKALYWMKKNISVNPLRASGYKSIGLVYTGLQDFALAEKNFKIALDLDPAYNSAVADLIRMYIMQGKCDYARQQIKEFLSKYPDDNNLNSAAGDIELFSSKLADAETFFKKTPDIPEYGYILLKNNQKDRADSLFKELIKLNKEKIQTGTNEFSYYYDLAKIYSILGNINESIYWLKMAVQNGWSYYLWSESDPLLENIKPTAEYKSIISGLKERINNWKKEINKAENI